MADTNWTLVILATTAGFFLLAFVLLFPVYRFMRREEEVSEDWTPDALARRYREETGRDGAPGGDGAPGASQGTDEP